jgi:hypothetical protein
MDMGEHAQSESRYGHAERSDPSRPLGRPDPGEATLSHPITPAGVAHRRRPLRASKLLENLGGPGRSGGKRPQPHLTGDRRGASPEVLAALAPRQVSSGACFGDRRLFSVGEGGERLARNVACNDRQGTTRAHTTTTTTRQHGSAHEPDLDVSARMLDVTYEPLALSTTVSSRTRTQWARASPELSSSSWTRKPAPSR